MWKFVFPVQPLCRKVSGELYKKCFSDWDLFKRLHCLGWDERLIKWRYFRPWRTKVKLTPETEGRLLLDFAGCLERQLFLGWRYKDMREMGYLLWVRRHSSKESFRRAVGQYQWMLLPFLKDSFLQCNELDIRVVWKSNFNRDLRFPGNTLQQKQTLWQTANTSETCTKVIKPKFSLVCTLFQQMQRKLHKGRDLPRYTQSPHCALFSKLKMSQGGGKIGNSMLYFVAQGSYYSLP